MSEIKSNKPYSGFALLVADTFIDGSHVKAGTVRNVSATNFSLLTEANRCVKFDPENPTHRTALENTKKADAAAKKAAEEAEAAEEKRSEEEDTKGGKKK